MYLCQIVTILILKKKKSNSSAIHKSSWYDTLEFKHKLLYSLKQKILNVKTEEKLIVFS